MPIGPYGGAPGFRSPAMRSPKPAVGGAGSGGPLDAGGGNPAPRPMAPERPAGTQMFSGMRSPTSFGGTQVTPYERYMGTNPADRMNQKEFWQSGQAPQYSTSNVIRSALGMDPAAHPLVADALRRRRMQPGQGGPGMGRGGPARGQVWPELGGRPAVGGGMGGYGSGTFAPAPRPMGPPVTLPGSGGPSILGAPTLGGPRPTQTYQVPVPDWAQTPPSIQPMPPVALGVNDPRLTVLR